MGNHQEISSFIWGICDDSLRGLFKQHEYGDVILPLVVLRRLDCVLEPYKKEIVEIHNQFKDKRDDTLKSSIPNLVSSSQITLNMTLRD